MIKKPNKTIADFIEICYNKNIETTTRKKKNMETVTITESMQFKYELPAKAVGTWAITVRGDEICTLHILKHDGTLGSNRKNNIYRIGTKILNELLDKPKPVEVPIGVRKAKWIDGVISEMESDPFLLQYLEKEGKNKIRAKILEDTNPERVGGKAYSSMQTAIKFWHIRVRKGD